MDLWLKTVFVSINARMLIKEIFPQLKLQGSGLVSVAVPDIYMNMPYKITNKKGKVVTKQRFTQIASVVAMSLKEDEDLIKENVVEENINEQAAQTGGLNTVSTCLAITYRSIRKHTHLTGYNSPEG